MATGDTRKNDKKAVKAVKAAPKAKAAPAPKSARKLAAEDKRRAKERTKATGELKDGLAATVNAAGHTAEVLAADVKAGADKATTTAKARSAEAAITGVRMVSRVPKSAWSVALGVAATGGILVKWLSSRRAKNRET